MRNRRTLFSVEERQTSEMLLSVIVAVAVVVKLRGGRGGH